MKRFCLVAILALCTPLAMTSLSAQAKPATQKPATAKPAAKAAAGRTIDITGGDDMKFNMTQITAKPGETLHVRLKNVGTLPKMAMAHNFVVLKPAANVSEFTTAAASARDTEYIPASQKANIVAHTALAGPGETVEVTFKVPAAAGTYPYLCSFPGHYAAGMKGSLVVK